MSHHVHFRDQGRRNHGDEYYDDQISDRHDQRSEQRSDRRSDGRYQNSHSNSHRERGHQVQSQQNFNNEYTLKDLKDHIDKKFSSFEDMVRDLKSELKATESNLIDGINDNTKTLEALHKHFTAEIQDIQFAEFHNRHQDKTFEKQLKILGVPQLEEDDDGKKPPLQDNERDKIIAMNVFNKLQDGVEMGFKVTADSIVKVIRQPPWKPRNPNFKPKNSPRYPDTDTLKVIFANSCYRDNIHRCAMIKNANYILKDISKNDKYYLEYIHFLCEELNNNPNGKYWYTIRENTIVQTRPRFEGETRKEYNGPKRRINTPKGYDFGFPRKASEFFGCNFDPRDFGDNRGSGGRGRGRGSYKHNNGRGSFAGQQLNRSRRENVNNQDDKVERMDIPLEHPSDQPTNQVHPGHGQDQAQSQPQLHSNDSHQKSEVYTSDFAKGMAAKDGDVNNGDEYFLKTPNSRLLGNRIGRGISSMFQRISPVSFNASTPQDNRHEAGKRKKNIETSPPCTLNQAKKLDGDNIIEKSPIPKNNEHLQTNLINHNSSGPSVIDETKMENNTRTDHEQKFIESSSDESGNSESEEEEINQADITQELIELQKPLAQPIEGVGSVNLQEINDIVHEKYRILIKAKSNRCTISNQMINDTYCMHFLLFIHKDDPQTFKKGSEWCSQALQLVTQVCQNPNFYTGNFSVQDIINKCTNIKEGKEVPLIPSVMPVKFFQYQKRKEKLLQLKQKKSSPNLERSKIF